LGANFRFFCTGTVIGRYLLHISIGMLMGKMQQNMKVLLSSRVKLNK